MKQHASQFKSDSKGKSKTEELDEDELHEMGVQQDLKHLDLQHSMTKDPR
jgi:hypothetical protein